MAKRLTDTDKWDDPWFMELRADLKLVWIYLTDNCDHAGIWKVNHKIAEFRLGFKVAWEDALESFKNRVFTSKNGGDWFIPKFMKFQYGADFSNGSAVASAIREIRNKGFYDVACEQLGDNFVGKCLSMDSPPTVPPLSPHSPPTPKAKAMAPAILNYQEGGGGTGEGVKKETDLQKVVRGWKLLTGVPTSGSESIAWDRVHFARSAASARQLILLFGSVKGAVECMEFVYDEMKQKGLTVTIETIVKRSDLYREHLAGVDE